MSTQHRSPSSVFTEPVALSAEPPGGRSLGRSVVAIWCGLIGLLVTVTTLYGVYRNSSSIPYMDQWDGVIAFWRGLQEGHSGVWWAQHNEHRIVFSRAVFWIDLKFFGGLSAFSITMNVVLHLAIALTFIVAYLRNGARRPSVLAVVGIVLLLRFAWMQEDNLIWGFQSQFIAVYLFAMLAFLCYCDDRGGPGPLSQSVAFVFAGLSMLSMSNGLLAFPLLVVAGVCLRFSRGRLLLAVTVTLVAWAIYFSGYTTPAFHASPLDGLLHHPVTVTKFAIVFLGSPVSYLGSSILVAAISGMALLVAFALFAGYMVFYKKTTGYRIFLCASFCFAALAAFLAATGRFDLGVASASASRYTTPALIAWLSLFMLFTDLAPARHFWAVVLLLSVTLLPAVAWHQKAAFAYRPEQYAREVAVLGHKMGVEDDVYLDALYPGAMRGRLLELMDYADRERLSVYGTGWVAQIGHIAFDHAAVDTSLCTGSMDAVTSLPRAYRVNGWARSLTGDNAPLVVLADASGRTVGYAVIGEARPDVAAAVPGADSRTGWRGYVVQPKGEVTAYLYTRGRFCTLASNVSM